MCQIIAVFVKVLEPLRGSFLGEWVTEFIASPTLLSSLRCNQCNQIHPSSADRPLLQWWFVCIPSNCEKDEHFPPTQVASHQLFWSQPWGKLTLQVIFKFYLNINLEEPMHHVLPEVQSTGYSRTFAGHPVGNTLILHVTVLLLFVWAGYAPVSGSRGHVWWPLKDLLWCFCPWEASLPGMTTSSSPSEVQLPREDLGFPHS